MLVFERQWGIPGREKNKWKGPAEEEAQWFQRAVGNKCTWNRVSGERVQGMG